MQAISSFSMFILAPWFYLKVAEQKSLQTLNTRNDYSWILLLYAFLLPLMVMPLTKLLVEWNEAIKLPPFLADFEQWAYQKEQELRKLTTFLTNFQSFGAFLVGVLIIAIIPAIGEEMVFRGLLQRKLGNIFSQHVAIWVAAFIFSAIHIQFYGLLPRMFLGVLLGYLYAWSGNIAYPMIAHFANNFLTLLMIYLYKIQWINVDIQSEVSVAWYSVAISLVFSSIALRDFYTRATGRA
ncbi:MAG: CPBP family intramembrane glutamic endopeptidase [Bacteroidia bacterium]|nr:CPBP family intramembrane glutamic endopeptidase [Bacteroidia bacterium]